jgi:hypothetical protein
MKTDPDTLFIFSMRPEGFINAYSAKGFYQNLDSLIQIYKDLANRIPDGKGFYSFDGVHFHTQVTFDRVGHSYILNGSVITENKTEISGDFNFNSNNRYGIFFIHPIEMWVK